MGRLGGKWQLHDTQDETQHQRRPVMFGRSCVTSALLTAVWIGRIGWSGQGINIALHINV